MNGGKTEKPAPDVLRNSEGTGFWKNEPMGNIPDGAALGAQLQNVASNGYPDTHTEAIWRGELSERHKHTLEVESAISPESIGARGYFTATDPHLLELHGYPKNQRQVPALVIPLWNWQGERAGVVLRLTIERSDRNGKKVKYDLPTGASPALDVSPLTRGLITDTSSPLIITEGAKKADATASRGLCAINLNGVWGFVSKGVPLPDWEQLRPYLRGRVVFIAYDSDVSRKRGVETAMRRLEALLKSLGAKAKVIYLEDGPDGAKTGLDDFFARGGTVEQLWLLARDLEPVEESNRKRREKEKADKRAKIEEEAHSAGVPTIETNNRQQADELADLSSAIERLNTREPSVFFGFNGLVRIARDAKDVPRLKSANRSTIQAIAGRAARWIRTTEREGTSNVAPPRDLCEIYLDDQNSWQGIPPIQGTASAPFFAPDGTLCALTGYHYAARLWLELPTNFDLGDTTPTPENIEAARRVLLGDILGEVSFADAASRAHAVAQMLLPFVRNLINGPTPLHIWNAPLRSSGKSYAAALCILPFCEPSPTPEKSSAEEWRKSLLAELQTGPSHIFLDNLKGNLNSSALDMAITSGVFRDRATGTGEMVSAPARCVWVATANNAELSEDAATRSILIQIDPNCENPESREFAGNPQEFIRRNRAKVCGAILTLVRAWQAAGAPNYSGPNRCRFPEWARVLGGILEVADICGFLDNIAEQRASIGGDAQSEWHEFTSLWFEAFGETFVGTRELLPLALKVENLAATLEKSQGDAAKSQALSRLLKKRRDRVFGEVKLRNGPQIQKRSSFRLQRSLSVENQGVLDTLDTLDTIYTRNLVLDSESQNSFLNSGETADFRTYKEGKPPKLTKTPSDDSVFDDVPDLPNGYGYD